MVVAPRCVNDAGLIYEQDAPVVLPLATPLAELGHQARAALLAFRHKHRDLGNLRQTEWPAYRASKARSLKAFHAQFVYLDIETVNANLRVTGFPIGERHLFVGSYLAPVRDDEALGTLLFRVFGSCLKLSPPTDTVPTAT